MITLLIETSTDRSIVSLIKENRLLAHRELTFGYKNVSKELIPSIQQLLADSKLTFRECDLFAVGIGPGSFTSVRIGVIVAKSIALVHKKPVVGISCLTGYFGDSSESSIAVIDANTRGVYLMKSGSEEPLLVSIDQLHHHLMSGCTIYTPNSNRIKEIIEAQCPQAKLCRWEERAPCPLIMSRKAIEKFKQGATHVDILYLNAFNK